MKIFFLLPSSLYSLFYFEKNRVLNFFKRRIYKVRYFYLQC
nr:MAG TPA: hypothetical protein [Caudoviricetes sp.]DAV96422.1 MAG TPA: hypothetical protein [Caudoviricetes sp.]